MKIDTKRVAVLSGALVGVVVVISFVFYAGFKYGFSQTKNIVVAEVTNIHPNQDTRADFSVFWQAWDKIQKKYIDSGELDPEELVRGAMRGLVEAIGDPNTVYFSPEDSQKFNEDISGNFGGVGAEIGIRDDKLVVIAPLKNTPAERVGLKSGDHIVEIDGNLTAGMDVFEAVKLIRGQPGTEVVLTVKKAEDGKPEEVSIIREVIVIPTVEWEIMEAVPGRKIIYVQMFNFNSNTPGLFYEAMINAFSEGGQGMILDLRNNPGGFLEVAVNIAGWFLERGELVVTEKFSSGEEDSFFANGNSALLNLPTVILINEGSASASEILAGALRDHQGIKLVGTKSFGKGTVQQLEGLKDDSSIKITVAKWLTPNGTIIEVNGLEPDFVVEFTEEDAEKGVDPQFEKAMEVLIMELGS